MKTLVFDKEQAIKYGVEEAIMLWHIDYWIEKNRANGKNKFEGRYWTYNSVNAFQELFPFWSVKQIRRILKSLEEQGLIIKGNWSEDKYDKTNWYTLTDKYYQEGEPISQDGRPDVTKSDSPFAQMGESYTDILPNKEPNNNIPPLYPPKGETPSLNKKSAQAQPIPQVPLAPLPFKSAAFKEVWDILCSSKKWRCKTNHALNISLKKLSHLTEEEAIEAIENAIEGDWQGLWPDKYKKKQAPQQQSEGRVITDAADIEKLLRG